MDLDKKVEEKTYQIAKNEPKVLESNSISSNLIIHSDFKIFSKSSPKKKAFSKMKETIQFELTKQSIQLMEDSSSEMEEIINNVSNEYDKTNNLELECSLENIVKKSIDNIIKDIINMLSSNRPIEDAKIKILKSKVNEMIHKNNLDSIDIINILTQKLNDLITSHKDCVLENHFSIQIKETIIQDKNFKKDEFINKYKSEINSVIDKLCVFYGICLNSSKYLEEIFEYVIKKLGLKNRQLSKINIESIIKEEFANCFIKDPLMRKFKSKIGMKHFKILKDDSPINQLEVDLKRMYKYDFKTSFSNEFINDNNHSALIEKIKPNIKFKNKEGSMELNELLEYILKDENLELAPKKKKAKNKKKRNDKNCENNIENVNIEDNEIYEFRNKLRDSSVKANLTKKIIPKFSLNFIKNLENLEEN